jgi:hypothetical protein
VRAAELGFVKLGSALDKLQQTNFRVAPEMIQELLLEDDRRPGPSR